MSVNRRIDRRRFMRIMTGLGAVIIFKPSSVFGRIVLREGWTSYFQMLIRLLNHPQSAAAVGKAYLRMDQESADRMDLVRRIVSGPIFEQTGTAGIEPLTLLSMLQRQVRRDFEHGETVEIDGWILSVSEARFCALVALSDP